MVQKPLGVDLASSCLALRDHGKEESTSLCVVPLISLDIYYQSSLLALFSILHKTFISRSHFIPNILAQLVKNPPAMQETLVQFQGREDPLEGRMANYSSILAWRIPMDRGA